MGLQMRERENHKYLEEWCYMVVGKKSNPHLDLRHWLNGNRLNGNSLFFRVGEKVITLRNLILMHGFLLFLNTHTLYK